MENYKREHESDEEFVASAKQVYIEKNEDEIRAEAVERCKNDHCQDLAFVRDAKRLWLEEER